MIAEQFDTIDRLAFLEDQVQQLNGLRRFPGMPPGAELKIRQLYSQMKTFTEDLRRNPKATHRPKAPAGGPHKGANKPLLETKIVRIAP